MKKFFLWVFVLLTAAYWGVPKIAAQIGTYLIVHEEFENVEYLITRDLTPKTVEYLNNGKVEKVLMVVDDNPSGSWRAFYIKNADLKIRAKAARLGIPQDKILIYKRKLLGRIDRVVFYKHVLANLKAESALFFAPFYKTRTRRFFLDKYFEDVNIKTYVQHEEPIDMEKLKYWWKKTTYANLFLEQYLSMGFYYVNKFLWTRSV